jgi:TolB protein
MNQRRSCCTLLLLGAALTACTPSNPAGRARALLELGDPVRAAALLERVVADDPAAASPRVLLLTALCRCDSATAALREFLVLARMAPERLDDPELRAAVAAFAGAEPYGVTCLTPQPGNDAVPCFSGDGTMIAFSSRRVGNAEIFVMNADGSDQRRVTNDPAIDYNPAFSPDGRMVAYVSDRHGQNELYLYDLKQRNQRRLTYNGADDQQPKFSPDGQELYFLSDRGGRYTIWRMGLRDAGSGREAAAAPAFADSTIKLYFDTQGGRILIQEQDGGEVRLALGPLETFRTQPIAFPRFRAAVPAILSPDGRCILYVSDRDGNDELYLFDIGTGRSQRLTVNPGQDFGFGFSPDGRRILFDSVRDGVRDVYLMDLDRPLPLDRLIRLARTMQP